MAIWAKMWVLVSIIAFILNLKMELVKAAPQVPCYFSFGDSLVDTGNNNAILTLAKANYGPYGIDFPGGSTGRFTNAENLLDFLAQHLGFSSTIPPYATASGNEILRGVNYAGGGGGIRDETGYILGDRISLNRQLSNHAVTYARLALLLLRNNTSVTEYLGKCLYTVVIGNNDYIDNYFLPQYYLTSRLYTPEQYAQLLINQYSQQLRLLYSYGARKIAIFGVGLAGCIPFELKRYPVSPTTGCVESINSAIALFNNKLPALVDSLTSSLPNSKFIFINTTSASLFNFTAAGITNINSSCCRVQTIGAQGLCVPGSTPCPNRNAYLFYDDFHPTRPEFLVFASRAYQAQAPTDAYPFDIRTLVNNVIP